MLACASCRTKPPALQGFLVPRKFSRATLEGSHRVSTAGVQSALSEGPADLSSGILRPGTEALMNVHVSYRAAKTPELEREFHHQIEKLQRRLHVFKPDLIHLRAFVEQEKSC